MLKRRNILLGAGAAVFFLAGALVAVLVAPKTYTCGDLVKAVNDSVYFTSVHGSYEPNPYQEKTKEIYAYAVTFAKAQYPKSLFIQNIKESPLALTALCQAEGSEKPISDMVSMMIHSNPEDTYSDEGIERNKEQEVQSAQEAETAKENADDRRLVSSWRPGIAQTISPGKIIIWTPSRDGTPKTYLSGRYKIDFRLKQKGDDDYEALLTLEFGPHNFSTKVPMTMDFSYEGTGQNTRAVPQSGLRSMRAEFAVVKLDRETSNDLIMFSYNTGGAHAVQWTKIANHGEYGWKLIDVSAIDGGEFELPQDVNGDGIPDIVTSLAIVDGFADSSADEWSPPVVFDLVNGALRDVTAASVYGRNLLRKDILETKKSCLHAQNESPVDPNAAPSPGSCAAYVLDSVRLDHNQLLAALEFDERQTKDYSGPLPSGVPFDEGCKVSVDPKTYECPAGEKKWASRREALVGTLEEAGYITQNEAQTVLAAVP